MDILSFLDVVELCHLRYLNSTCYVMIERLCENYVRSCDRKKEKQLLENNGCSFTTWEQELFICSDFENKQFEHLFPTWGDLAIKRALYERAIPFCCTLEQIEQLKSNVSSTTHGVIPPVKVTVLGDVATGKSLLCQSMASGPVDFDSFTYNPTIGAAFLVVRRCFKTEDYKLELWDTAGLERYRSLLPMYIRGTNMILLMIRLDKEESLKWLMDSYSNFDDTSAFKIVIATGKDLKRDNRLSYTALEFCAKHGISYYECSLKDPNQPFYVIYSLLDQAQKARS